MILVSNDIRSRYPKAFKKARRERIRAVRLETDLWYCARRESGHGRYLIRFKVLPAISGGEQVYVECRDVEGQRCKGTFKDNCCVHIAEVIDRGVKHGRKQQKRAA
jgi:hypothetical protein